MRGSSLTPSTEPSTPAFPEYAADGYLEVPESLRTLSVRASTRYRFHEVRDMLKHWLRDVERNWDAPTIYPSMTEADRDVERTLATRMVAPLERGTDWDAHVGNQLSLRVAGRDGVPMSLGNARYLAEMIAVERPASASHPVISPLGVVLWAHLFNPQMAYGLIHEGVPLPTAMGILDGLPPRTPLSPRGYRRIADGAPREWVLTAEQARSEARA